ncbi:MAG: hemerythrin family protein [Deltaproteobacteria bacterium]|nr:hemerythrin family protein [Deltaproteobacteria bacterium]
MSHALLISWNSSSELGIPVLDEQHRGIVSIINSFGFSMQGNTQSEFYLNTIFTMMDCYTKLHFSTEEELFCLASYPGMEEHKKQHRNLINKSFSIGSKSMRLRDPNIYLDFLQEWWVTHINEDDLLYGPCIRKYLCI